MREFAGTTILVVGGAGFVGSNLTAALLTAGPREVIVVDNLLSSERESVPVDPAITFVEGPITNDAVLAGLPENLDYVFHLATYHGNQSSMHDPLADYQNNALTTLKLYERVKAVSGLRKVVYASAGCTVADKTFDTARATDEDAPVSLHLDTPYQISKIIGEYYSNYYFTRFGLPAVKARFQNVYGPGEILGAGRWRGTPNTVWRNVTPTFVYRALKGDPLPVENGGIATRDFIYVDDIVRGLIACALQAPPGEVYNLASGVETSILELAESINEMTGNAAPIEVGPTRDWDRSGKRFGSTAKARDQLGFEVDVGIEEGLRRTIGWTRESLATIDACVERHREQMLALAQAGDLVSR